MNAAIKAGLALGVIGLFGFICSDVFDVSRFVKLGFAFLVVLGIASAMWVELRSE